MDTGTTIIGAALLAICILPLILMRRNRNNKKKQLLKRLLNIASKYNCKIDQYDYCRDFVIGLDENTNSVLFYRQGEKEEIVKHVDLAEIINCKIISNSRSNGDNKDKIIDRLELSLIPISKNKTTISIEFYNSDETFELTGELQLIEKWSKTINSRLANNRNNRNKMAS